MLSSTDPCASLRELVDKLYEYRDTFLATVVDYNLFTSSDIISALQLKTPVILCDAQARFIELIRKVVKASNNKEAAVEFRLREVLLAADKCEAALKNDDCSQQKAQLYFLRGKAMMILSLTDGATIEPNEARVLLLKSLKFDPSLSDAWCELAELSWMEGDPLSAIKPLRSALEYDAKHSESLWRLSMLLRQIPSDNQSVANPQQLESLTCIMDLLPPCDTRDGGGDPLYLSVRLAHAAVSAAPSSGRAWECLGNALLSAFLSGGPKCAFITRCLAAFTQAAKDRRVAMEPHFHYNHGIAWHYQDHFPEAIKSWLRAAFLDPAWPTPINCAMRLATTMLRISAEVDAVPTRVRRQKQKEQEQLAPCLVACGKGAEQVSAERVTKLEAGLSKLLGPFYHPEQLAPAIGSEVAAKLKVPNFSLAPLTAPLPKLQLVFFDNLKVGSNIGSVCCGRAISILPMDSELAANVLCVDAQGSLIVFRIYQIGKGLGPCIKDVLVVPDPFVEECEVPGDLLRLVFAFNCSICAEGGVGYTDDYSGAASTPAAASFASSNDIHLRFLRVPTPDVLCVNGRPIGRFTGFKSEMRSRYDKNGSHTPNDVDCAGKIIIRNIRMRFVSDASLRLWLDKYGTIQETKLYSSCAVVKFSSDLEAAGAVQCENGIRRFGSVACIKHAEPHGLWSLERSESERSKSPPEASFQRGSNSDQSRSRRRYATADEEAESGRSYKRPLSPSLAAQAHRPNRNNPTSRDSHPLTWLSEAAAKSSSNPPTVQAGDRTLVDTSEVGPQVSASTAEASGGTDAPPVIPSRPYEVAILAITHDLVPYAEAVQESIAGINISTSRHQSNSPTSPTSHIMVLVNVDHLTPCIQDLTNDGVLFAIIVNASNWTHSSCTLRILHSQTQQEHRNMPLGDAISLLAKDYTAYIASSSNNSSNQKRYQAPPPQQPPPPLKSKNAIASGGDSVEPDSDDPAFLKPTRHVTTLLRMLADSRVLSVGELDELASFIAERRARLTNQLSSGPGSVGANSTGNSGTNSNAALKSRILNMLYPKPSSIGANTQMSQSGGGAVAPASENQNLMHKLQNPSVQQALDNLMKTSQRGSGTGMIGGGGANETPSVSENVAPHSSLIAGQQNWHSWSNSEAQPPSVGGCRWGEQNVEPELRSVSNNNSGLDWNAVSNIGHNRDLPSSYGHYYSESSIYPHHDQHRSNYADDYDSNPRQSNWSSRGNFKRQRGGGYSPSGKPIRGRGGARDGSFESQESSMYNSSKKYAKRGSDQPQSRFVIPPQVISGAGKLGGATARGHGSGAQCPSSSSPNNPAGGNNGAKPPHLMSVNPLLPGQYYGGPSQVNAAPYAGDLGSQQPKDWSAYSSGYENY